MRRGRLIAGMVLVLFAAAIVEGIETGGRDAGVMFLPQGWSLEQRREFYHKPQGTQLIPLSWLLALKQKGSEEPFLSDANITKFRFIPDTKHKFNEYGLPVGFAVSQVPSKEDPSKLIPMVGLNCAACHTGQIIAEGKTIQIDGAPSMQNNIMFGKAMEAALIETISDLKKFDEFAKAVHPAHATTADDKDALRTKIKGQLDKLGSKRAIEHARKGCDDPLMRRKYDDPNFAPNPDWGFGRLDAIGRVGNTVLAEWHPCNLNAADAPVSIPKIWSAWKYDWMQWTAFVENPLARNLAQALALGADEKTKNWLTSLNALEDRLHTLQPPHWEDLFGRTNPIDQKLADEGKTLYYKGRPNRPVKGGLCAHCHIPKMRLLKECDGKAELAVVMIPVDEIGTDETTMANYQRPKHAGPSQQQKFRLPEVFQSAMAMERITTGMMAGGFEREHIPIERQRLMQRCRTNRWLNEKSYKAPTHEGVWATAPYLHNGSIPNLYLLLSQQEERDKQAKRFCVGHDLTYDPVNVGFRLTDRCPDQFLFDTTHRGNGNRGHEFRSADNCEKREGDFADQGVLGCALSHDERRALVEYLKTL